MALSKQQTGFRVDRVLFKQFQEICKQEKLRPGEAVESLMRSAVSSGSIANISLNITRSKSHGQNIDRMLFKSKLSRMKNLLENQRGYLKANGNMHPYGVDDELFEFEKGIAELAKNCPDEQLTHEFEKILGEMDEFLADTEKTYLADKLKED